jgi:hypothetical protein
MKFFILPLITFLVWLAPKSFIAQELAWAKSMGGNGFDRGESITIDSQNNVYTLGYFTQTVDFNPGSGTFEVTAQGEADIFLTKFDASGNFVWAKTIGSSDSEYPDTLVLDASGNLLITGYFETDLDFDPGAGTQILTSAGNLDAFILKLDADGNYLWAKSFGSNGRDRGQGIAVDNSGNVVTIGYFNNTVDFDPGAGTAELTSFGDEDIFIVKLDANGNYLWAKQLGGTREDFPNAVAVDAAGNVYSTGSYTNSAPDFDPGPGTFLLESAGTLDKMFVSKLDASGNFVWAKQASGSHYNVGTDIAIGPNSEVLVTGYFYATQDFDPGAATFELTSEGLADAYILKLETNGNFVWAKRMGGPLYEEGVSIKTDSNGGIYTTGRFEETVDFDPNGGTANLSSEGFIDVFVQHLNASGNFQWASSVGGQDEDCGLGIAVDTQGKVLCTGYFNTTADFDPGSGVFNLTSQGEMDVFILKLENAPLGIPNNLESREAVIHPNPFQDILTVGSNGTIDTIVVYDFFGRIVLETFPLALKTELNLGYLKSGLYLATIYSEGKKSVKKIIKE